MPSQQAPHLVAISGSYRTGGTIDTTIDAVLGAARERGATTETIRLVDEHLEFCRNCRQCTQTEGPDRGPCVIDDRLDAILQRLESADGIVLAAPVNLGDVTAITRQLMERMVGYAHWPWERVAPRVRRRPSGPPAVLATSSAAPGLLTRVLGRPLRTLAQMARLLGARPIGSLAIGPAGGKRRGISERAARHARRLGGELERRARSYAAARQDVEVARQPQVGQA